MRRPAKVLVALGGTLHLHAGDAAVTHGLRAVDAPGDRGGSPESTRKGKPPAAGKPATPKARPVPPEAGRIVRARKGIW